VTKGLTWQPMKPENWIPWPEKPIRSSFKSVPVIVHGVYSQLHLNILQVKFQIKCPLVTERSTWQPWKYEKWIPWPQKPIISSFKTVALILHGAYSQLHLEYLQVKFQIKCPLVTKRLTWQPWKYEKWIPWPQKPIISSFKAVPLLLLGAYSQQ
jgi:hypothetical protein